MKDSFQNFSIAFAVVYALAYVIAVENNYALVTYHPALEKWGWLVEPARDGPAMHWYGWMATAGLVAAVIAALASILSTRLGHAFWSGWSWSVPLAVIAFFGYLLKGFFTR